MHGISLGDVAVQAAAVAKPNIFDTINNALTKVVQPAANIYTQIKTNQPASSVPGATSTPGMPAYTPPPAPAPVDNTKKYLLIGGAVVVVGTGIYFLTRKKKK